MSREYGTGTLEEVAPCLWRLRVSVGTRRISRNFRASKSANRGGRAEAQKALREFAAEVRAGDVSKRGAVTFAALATEYLANIERQKALTSVLAYRIALEKRVIPSLGKVKLDKLTAHHLDRLYRKLETEYASTTVEFTAAVVSATLTQAVKWGWLSKNVASNATVRAGKPKTRDALSPEDVTRLIRAAIELDEDYDMATLIFLLCLVGGRRGEACGFQWGDVDWARQQMRVERQIVPIPGGHEVVPPKGNKTRVEAIGEVGVRWLGGYLERLRERLGPTWSPEPKGWLVSIDGGETPTRAKGVTPHIERLGARLDPPIDARPHDFRRFSVTQLFGAGIDSRAIQERHGHYALEITERYALNVPARDQLAAEAMGSVLADALSAMEVAPPAQ